MKFLMFAVFFFACTDRTDEQIRGNVTLLIHHEGVQAQNAAERLARFGARAIPTIEAALHTAPPSGRKNLVLALRRIGDVEAIPLLKHLALHDQSEEVKREASWTLKQWAAGKDRRAEKARAAVRALEEQQGKEESG